MKTRGVVSLFILIFPLVGCFAPSQSIATTAMAELTQTGSPSPSPEAAAQRNTPTPFLIPTLSISQVSELTRLLESEICNLPCYLGIQPGKTKFEEAGNIITKLGGIVRADYENFYEGNPERSPLKLRSYLFHVGSLPYMDLDISGQDNQVQQMVFNISGNSEPLFYDSWARYSIESIFKNFGRPDQILIYAGERYDVRVVYLNYGLIIDWAGAQNDNYFDHKLCPKFSKENGAGLMVAIANTKFAFEIVPSSYMGLKEMWRSTDETLGVGEKDFYDQVVADNSVCFDLRK